ncbi:TRAP transporter permease [Alloalcanivorax sp. C16-2]|uniref:TRAP transporter permease n=1 Tax=Alloalcanivorax sp. C16-2 TaxID=3390052 RepID=UPI00397115A0
MTTLTDAEHNRIGPPGGVRWAPFTRASIAILITGLSLGWTAELPRLLWGRVYLVQEFSLIILGLCLALIYLSRDPRGRAWPGPPSLVSTAAALIALSACWYAAYRYKVLSAQMFYFPVETFIIGAIVVPAVVEGLRRMVGWALVIIVLLFIAYGLWGNAMPAPFTARPWSVADLAPHLVLDTTAMVGLPITIGVTVVIPFIFFGVLLNKAGGGDFFSDLAVAAVGRFRGGSGKIAIVASALFGTISGSAVSNVVSTGVISIPLMKRSGFSGRVAAATESVASTGGQFMPPVMGAAAFLMAELSQTPYETIVLAAVLPALFFFFAVFMQSDADAICQDVAPVPREDRKPFSRVMLEGGHFVLPFVLLIVLLFNFNQSPELSALAAAGLVAVLGLVRGYGGDRIGLADLIDSFKKTGTASMEILAIVAAAGFVIGILNATGVVFALTSIMVDLSGGNVVLLLALTAVISIILGMGMPTVAVYVLLASLVVPALVSAGVPKLSAHMFVLYYGMMSMITPPIAIAAYAASSIAEEKPLAVSVTAMRYAWLAYLVPFIFVFRPEMLLSKSHLEIPGLVEVVLVTTLLILILNGALSGYFKGRLSVALRVLLAATGVAVFLALLSGVQAPLVYTGAVLIMLACAGRRAWRRRVWSPSAGQRS